MMSRFIWEADAAADKCWVVYERVSSERADGFAVRRAVLTVWDTTPVQVTGRPEYAHNKAIRTLIFVTKEINGGILPDNIMDAVVVTMEMLE